MKNGIFTGNKNGWKSTKVVRERVGIKKKFRNVGWRNEGLAIDVVTATDSEPLLQGFLVEDGGSLVRTTRARVLHDM